MCVIERTEKESSLKSKQPKGKMCLLYIFFIFAIVGPINLPLKNVCNFQKFALGLCVFYTVIIVWMEMCFHHRDGFIKCLIEQMKSVVTTAC